MENQPLLVMKKICKSFPGVRALDEVSIEVLPQEIVGLVGENGAGKSTLMKVLAGIYQPDSGEIIFNGQRVFIRDPQQARSLGIAMVFQEQAVLPNLMVYENIFLGNEKKFASMGVINRERMVREAENLLREIGINISPLAYLHELSFMERQMVEILRNIWVARQAEISNPLIVLDEPTTVLEEREVELLFSKLRELKKQISVIYISHRLNEIVELCDRVYVMKDGKNAACFKRGEFDEDLLRSKMVGREFHGEYYLISEQVEPSPKVILELKNCTRKGVFEDVSFQLREGEIISICGVVGSGKEELCLALYGLMPLDAGKIYLHGEEVQISSPAEAFALGIGYIPEDRRNDGLVLNLPVFENVTLPILYRLRKGLFLDRESQLSVSKNMIEKLRIKTPSPFALCRNLSGGNQQKVVLSKWLLSKVKILIMSHPTRGVDVGAKHEIYALIREFTRQGMAMILIGDSFEEDIGLANRIITMKDGRITGILDATTCKPNPSDLIGYVV
ncbi:MAG: sugar ABC transporter ATP-binding protein [Atribacterota bacterium]|nr:sugar ABC transporter ATP-binding protein [Atribacterota bacterium]